LEICGNNDVMLVVGTTLVDRYFEGRAGHQGTRAARMQFAAWLTIASRAKWRTPDDVKRAHPKASILKGGRAVFNIKGNDFRLVAALDYRAGVVRIRFFGTHAAYDTIDAETV
jgi:mRNA interferase HigB